MLSLTSWRIFNFPSFLEAQPTLSIFIKANIITIKLLWADTRESDDASRVHEKENLSFRVDLKCRIYTIWAFRCRLGDERQGFYHHLENFHGWRDSILKSYSSFSTMNWIDVHNECNNSSKLLHRLSNENCMLKASKTHFSCGRGGTRRTQKDEYLLLLRT